MGSVELLQLAAAAGLLLATGVAIAFRRPEAVVGRPRVVLGVVAAATLLSLAALVRVDPPGLRLAIDPSTEPLLPAGDPAREDYRRAVRDFGDDEVYVIAMETEAGVFRSEALEALRRIGHAVARLPGVTGVTSLADVTAFRYDAGEDWIEVRPFVEAIPEAPEALAALRAEALAEPLYRRILVSDDARTAALNVSFRAQSDAAFIASGADAAVARILAAETRPGRRFHVAGRPHVKARVHDLMLRDLAVLVPAALAVLAAVLAVATGSRRGVVVPLGTVAVATLWTFGAMAFLGRPLTLLSVLLAPVLIAVGSVYGVHVLAHFDEARGVRPDTAPPRAAALRGLERVRLPVLLAGTTTAAGFGALALSDVPAVRELGALAVLGIASVTALSLLAVPAWLALPGARHRPARAARLDAALDRGLHAVGEAVARASGRILAAWGVLALASLALLPRIEVDTDFLSFFSPDAPVRCEFEAVNRLLAGAVPLYVTLAGEPGTFREPETLRALAALEARVDRLPGVTHAGTFLDTLRRLNRAFSRDEPAAERIPDSRSAVAELLFLVPKGDLGRFLNLDHARANLVARTGEVGSAAVRAQVARIEDAVAATLLPGVRATAVTGKAVLLARSADGIAAAQTRTVAVAALAILALVAWTFRSPRLGLLLMVPNLVPVLLFFGMLGAGLAPLSLPTSLVGAMTLGIAIDGTVHYVVRYRRNRAGGAAPEAASVAATRSVGRPVVLATVMLCAGFAVVGLSAFATLRQFGGLAAATLFVCLLADLVLLPALLVRARA